MLHTQPGSELYWQVAEERRRQEEARAALEQQRRLVEQERARQEQLYREQQERERQQQLYREQMQVPSTLLVKIIDEALKILYSRLISSDRRRRPRRRQRSSSRNCRPTWSWRPVTRAGAGPGPGG